MFGNIIRTCLLAICCNSLLFIEYGKVVHTCGKLEKTSGGKTTKIKLPNRFMVFVMRIVGKLYFNYRLANTLYYLYII